MPEFNMNLGIDYVKLLNLMAELVVILDDQGRIVLANRRVLEITGQKENEVAGKIWIDSFLPKKIRPEVKKIFKKVISGELAAAEFYENPILAKNGEERLVSWHNNLIKADDGKMYSVSLGRDITETVERQKSLETSEKRFRLLAENVTDLIVELDLKLNLTYLSPAMHTMTGYSVEEGKKNGLRKLLTPKSLIEVSKVMAFDLVLEKKRGSDPDRSRLLEIKLRKKDGSIIPVESKTKFLRDATGKAIGVIGVVRDIADRVEMRKKLKASLDDLRKQEAILKTIVDKSPLGIFIFDAIGKIEYANDAMMSISGTTKEKLMSQNLLDHAGYKAVGLDKLLAELIANKKEFKTEIIKYRSMLGGKETYRIFHGFPLLDDTGNLDKAFLTIEDVSSLKKTNEELQSLNKIMVDREIKMVELKREIEKIKHGP